MKKDYIIANLPILNNGLVCAQTSGGKGTAELNNISGKQPVKQGVSQDTIDTLIYFERKEGKQMLADGFKFKELHPNMQVALKYGKAYLKKHEG